MTITGSLPSKFQMTVVTGESSKSVPKEGKAMNSIGWCDFTINPIRARLRGANAVAGAGAGAVDAARASSKGGYGSGVGHYCEKISAGCANCYASTSQPRFGMPQFPGTQKRSIAPASASGLRGRGRRLPINHPVKSQMPRCRPRCSPDFPVQSKRFCARCSLHIRTQ